MGRLNSDRIHSSGGSSILTGDMVASDLKSGKTGYSNDPNTKITGTSTAIDTSDANALDSEIDFGKTAYVNGVKKTGTRITEYLINTTSLVTTIPVVSVVTAVAII